MGYYELPFMGLEGSYNMTPVKKLSQHERVTKKQVPCITCIEKGFMQECHCYGVYVKFNKWLLIVKKKEKWGEIQNGLTFTYRILYR